MSEEKKVLLHCEHLVKADIRRCLVQGCENFGHEAGRICTVPQADADDLPGSVCISRSANECA